MVRRLSIDGDAQADLTGHGGEIRAVKVYQLGSYRYWESSFIAAISAADTLEKTSPSSDWPTMKSA
jgi:MOSC domain-containing protein YiiM